MGVAQLCIEQPADFQRGDPEIPQLSPRCCGKQLTMKWINNNYTALMKYSGNTNTRFIRTANSIVRGKQIQRVQANASTTLKKCTQVFFSTQKSKTKRSCSPHISIRMSKYHNSPRAKSMRSGVHHVSKSPALKLKLPSRMRQKFPKRPSAYQIILTELPHTGCSPLQHRHTQHLFVFIR